MLGTVPATPKKFIYKVDQVTFSKKSYYQIEVISISCIDICLYINPYCSAFPLALKKEGQRVWLCYVVFEF